MLNSNKHQLREWSRVLVNNVNVDDIDSLDSLYQEDVKKFPSTNVVAKFMCRQLLEQEVDRNWVILDFLHFN